MVSEINSKFIRKGVGCPEYLQACRGETPDNGGNRVSGISCRPLHHHLASASASAGVDRMPGVGRVVAVDQGAAGGSGGREGHGNSSGCSHSGLRGGTSDNVAGWWEPERIAWPEGLATTSFQTPIGKYIPIVKSCQGPLWINLPPPKSSLKWRTSTQNSNLKVLLVPSVLTLGVLEGAEEDEGDYFFLIPSPALPQGEGATQNRSILYTYPTQPIGIDACG